MIIKRPEHCLCGDPTYRCKIACSCDGAQHDSDCHHGIWGAVPGWADAIDTDAVEQYNDLKDPKP